MSDPLDSIQPHPDWPRTRPAQTPLSRALRRLAQGKRLTSLDVRILEDAADELDELTASLAAQSNVPVVCAHCEHTIGACPSCGKMEWRIKHE